MHQLKKLLLLALVAMGIAACSSGTTEADLPSNVSSFYSGTFQSSIGNQSGVVNIDIQDVNGVVTGNIIFQSSGDNCLRSASVEGTSTGFNLSLQADQAGQRFEVTTTVREPASEGESEGALVSETVVLTTNASQGTTVTTLGNGNIQTRVVSAPIDTEGTLNLQLTISNAGNSLQGTYTTTGNVCSNRTGSGGMNLSR